jgi:outer membrane protein OmpA-like peptidoglycan-associated protein
MEDTNSQSHWIPLADLMTGLMMIFMLLAVAFMLRIEQTTTMVVEEFQNAKADLLAQIKSEFKKELPAWNAEVLGDLTIRFNDPAVLFDTGSSELRGPFKALLDVFFPRYVALITADKYKSVIKEVRIEGHTSAFWSKNMDSGTAYFKNMELSQSRTRSTLQYVLLMPSIQSDRGWLMQHVTANGLSSSRPMVVDAAGGTEHPANQRVEFRIVTSEGDSMQRIAESLLRGRATPPTTKPAAGSSSKAK